MTHSSLDLTVEQQRARQDALRATGDALAIVAHARGETLSADERGALTQWSRWGSTGYPIQKLGRQWTIQHRAAPPHGLYRTKQAATAAWETLIYKWIRMSGLAQAHDPYRHEGAR